MLTQDQNAIIYLMFLSGILLLGLNSVAYSMVFPGPKKSKRLGYMLFLCVLLAIVIQQEYSVLINFGFEPSETQKILLLGFVVPFYLGPMVFYRMRRNNMETKPPPLAASKINHEDH